MERERSWTGAAPEAITAWTLVRAGHVVGRRFWDAFAALGLSPTQFGVLLQLDLNPNMSNGEMARAVLVTPQSMSELLGSLVDLGLVERDVPPGRGHRVTARSTAAGRDALRQCASAVRDVEESLDLAPAAARTLNETLHHVMKSPPGPDATPRP